MNDSNQIKDTPVRVLVKNELSKFRNFLISLLEKLDDTSSSKRDILSRGNAETAFSEVMQEYGGLRMVLQVLRDHQEFHQRLIDLNFAIDETDAEILSISKVLRSTQKDIEKLVFESAKPLLGRMFSDKCLRPVDARSVLELAKNISFSTSAPPGWHPSTGREIIFPYSPPAPTEERVRAGQLFNGLEKSLRLLAAAEPSEGQAGIEKDDDTGAHYGHTGSPKFNDNKLPKEDNEKKLKLQEEFHNFVDTPLGDKIDLDFPNKQNSNKTSDSEQDDDLFDI